MNYVLSYAMFTLAAVVILFGDRQVRPNGGITFRVLAWPLTPAAILKWLLAAALIWAGVWLRGGSIS
jgi:hypothetical protein